MRDADITNLNFQADIYHVVIICHEKINACDMIR